MGNAQITPRSVVEDAKNITVKPIKLAEIRLGLMSQGGMLTLRHPQGPYVQTNSLTRDVYAGDCRWDDTVSEQPILRLEDEGNCVTIYDRAHEIIAKMVFVKENKEEGAVLYLNGGMAAVIPIETYLSHKRRVAQTSVHNHATGVCKLITSSQAMANEYIEEDQSGALASTLSVKIYKYPPVHIPFTVNLSNSRSEDGGAPPQSVVFHYSATVGRYLDLIASLEMDTTTPQGLPLDKTQARPAVFKLLNKCPADILCMTVIAYKLSTELAQIAEEQAAYRDHKGASSSTGSGSKLKSLFKIGSKKHSQQSMSETEGLTAPVPLREQ